MPAITIRKSTRKHKKYEADVDGRKIHFGDDRYEDYTRHRDKERRRLYRSRHKYGEDDLEPITAKTFSNYLLWGDSTSIKKNMAHLSTLINRDIRMVDK